MEGVQRLQAISMAPSREASDTGRNWQDADAGLRPTERVGVLLLNLGGPETLADVQPFLYNLFADDSIIRLPPYGEIPASTLTWSLLSIPAISQHGCQPALMQRSLPFAFMDLPVCNVSGVGMEVECCSLKFMLWHLCILAMHPRRD